MVLGSDTDDEDLSEDSSSEESSSEESSSDERSENVVLKCIEEAEKKLKDMDEESESKFFNKKYEDSLPNQYLLIIKMLETINVERKECYDWYKRLSKALLHRVEIDRRFCESVADKRLRNVLSDLEYPGIPQRSDATETTWKWSSRPLRKNVVNFFLPALSSYAHKHFGFEYTRLRFLIEKYDSIAELQIDQSGYGAHVLHEAENQEKNERSARFLTRELSFE
jgi:hypothetical protein